MKIMLLANDSTYVYNLRKEVIDALLEKKYQVSIVCKPINHVKTLQKMGCEVIPIEIQRHGKNPLQDLALYQFYRKTLKKLQPDVVLTYNIKPNIYGGTACSRLGISYLPNICGLGTALEYDGAMRKLTTFMYRIGMKKAQCVFFQNIENEAFFAERKMVSCKYIVLPGSGVNLKRFLPLPYPNEEKGVQLLYVGRLMREKGIFELFDAIQKAEKELPNLSFIIIGACEKEFEPNMMQISAMKNVDYFEYQADIKPFLEASHAIVLPSYHEGMSNALLEAGASARPIITTNVSGCRETMQDGVTGILVQPKNADSLFEGIKTFVNMSNHEKKIMGERGRKYIEAEFDRNLVVNAYMKEIEEVQRTEAHEFV